MQLFMTEDPCRFMLFMKFENIFLIHINVTRFTQGNSTARLCSCHYGKIQQLHRKTLNGLLGFDQLSTLNAGLLRTSANIYDHRVTSDVTRRCELLN